MQRPSGRGPGATASAAMLILSGLSQAIYGIAAITGNAALEQNVHDIESNPSFGQLYFSLAEWGVLLVLVGLGQLIAASALLRRRPMGRLVGLGATLFGLVAGFFTLAILHAGALASLVLLLLALYVLSYRVDG